MDIYDLAGTFLHRKGFDTEALSVGEFPATCSSPHGAFFYVGWSSSFFAFEVFDRSGRSLFNSYALRGRACQAFAFDDSTILIPVLNATDITVAAPVLHVYRVPMEQPQDSIEIPAPGMLAEPLQIALPPDGLSAALYTFHGVVAFIGSDLKPAWTAQPFQHVHHVALSENGQYVAVVGCSTPRIQRHSPELTLLTAESGQALWQVQLGKGCGDSLEIATCCYFAGPYILFPGKHSCLLFLTDSLGQLMDRECFPKKIDLLWINDTCVTVSQSESDDNVLVSEIWQR